MDELAINMRQHW